jgi:hypothetical protein
MMEKNRNFFMRTKRILFLASFLSLAAFSQDRSEGWVVRQTEKGLVKVPAKQYFRFEGLSLSGKAYSPYQATFDQRPSRKSKSLIPVRTSFKREVLDASGYSGR